MELENIILSEVSQAQKVKRPKATYFVLYGEYRPKTNAAISWDAGHTKGRLCTGWIGQEKETKNLNVVDVFNVQE
jgi:hypothetical protein